MKRFSILPILALLLLCSQSQAQVFWNHTWWSPYPTQNPDPDLVDVTWESAHTPTQPANGIEEIHTYAIQAVEIPGQPPFHALINSQTIIQQGRKTLHTEIVDKAIYLPNEEKDANGVVLYKYVDIYRKAIFEGESSSVWRIKKYPDGTVTAVEL